MPIKKEKFVSVREFLRNYKKLAEKDDIIIVSKNGKPAKVFLSYAKWEELNPPSKKRKINIKDLEQFAVSGGDPNLSLKIDDILYGENDN